MWLWVSVSYPPFTNFKWFFWWNGFWMKNWNCSWLKIFSHPFHLFHWWMMLIDFICPGTYLRTRIHHFYLSEAKLSTDFYHTGEDKLKDCWTECFSLFSFFFISFKVILITPPFLWETYHYHQYLWHNRLKVSTGWAWLMMKDESKIDLFFISDLHLKLS